jgi:hypothetical protein
MPGPLDASLDLLREGQTLVEQPFRSRLPLIGPLISWLRTRWNNVSTTWYVRPLVAQQNRFNGDLVEHLAAQNARMERVFARTEDFEARLQATDALLSAAFERLEECKLEECSAWTDDLTQKLHDHDAWLIARDREQSEYVRDLAEVTLQLIQLKRQLHDLDPDGPLGPAGPHSKESSE